jgi:hypothetical protein
MTMYWAPLRQLKCSAADDAWRGHPSARRAS